MKKIFLGGAIFSGTVALFSHFQYEKNYEKYNDIDHTSHPDYKELEKYYQRANRAYKIRNVSFLLGGLCFTCHLVWQF
jgi:hypothetical protein